MLGDDLKAVDGAVAGAWIGPGQAGEWGAVTQQVPRLFEAYARVFHPARDEDGNEVTWAEVARRLGRTAHPEMQWHQIVGTADTFGIAGSNWGGNIPELGEMELDDLDSLCALLAAHTADPEHCFFGLCEINHRDLINKIDLAQGRRPRLELHLGRNHLILSGPLAAVNRIGDTDCPGATLVPRSTSGGSPADHLDPGPADSFWRDAPSLIWPSDRSWFVASEVDFDSTLVGGSRALVDALVASRDLEVLEVTPNTLLTAFSDELNPVAEPDE
jgi:hypothetical protein